MIGKSLFVGDLVEWTALDHEKDAAALSAWTADPHFSQNLFNKPARPYAVHEVKKKVKEMLKEADEHHGTYYYAIRKKGSTELVALVRFGWLSFSHQGGRLFLDFVSPEAMQTYSTELMSMALRFAFMELSLHRLWTEVAGCDIESIQLLESAGFLREIQRREAVFSNGKYYDELIYSLLKPEWKARQEAEQKQELKQEVMA